MAQWIHGHTHGIRYAILRAKERRSLPSNLVKDQAKKKKKKLAQTPEDSSRGVGINVTQTLLHIREKHGEKMVHAAAPMHIACTNKQETRKSKGKLQQQCNLYKANGYITKN